MSVQALAGTVHSQNAVLSCEFTGIYTTACRPGGTGMRCENASRGTSLTQHIPGDPGMHVQVELGDLATLPSIARGAVVQMMAAIAAQNLQLPRPRARDRVGPVAHAAPDWCAGVGGLQRHRT